MEQSCGLYHFEALKDGPYEVAGDFTVEQTVFLVRAAE
jgi:hypothetical protein